jgi:formamidopyrimidine-DNA glycosylase
MPELPEVETVARGLRDATVGLRITAVRWLDPRLVKGAIPAEEVAARLAGQVVRGCDRRGKFLVWRFRSGDGLLLHLGMSGRLTVGMEPEAPWLPHTHLVVALANGREVRLRDPRRFGRVDFVPAGTAPFPRLGPDALSRHFTARYLAQAFSKRHAPVKSLLLDQRVVAGVGNIYADEALYRAGIHPLTPGGTLPEAAVRRLHRALRAVLRQAIRHRGTTFLTFEDAFGQAGSYAARLSVYGRSGLPCRRCGTPVATRVVGGRTAHYCPACQPGWEPDDAKTRGGPRDAAL